jgi:hypothetical protein
MRRIPGGEGLSGGELTVQGGQPRASEAVGVKGAARERRKGAGAGRRALGRDDDPSTGTSVKGSFADPWQFAGRHGFRTIDSSPLRAAVGALRALAGISTAPRPDRSAETASAIGGGRRRPPSAA